MDELKQKLKDFLEKVKSFDPRNSKKEITIEDDGLDESERQTSPHKVAENKISETLTSLKTRFAREVPFLANLFNKKKEEREEGKTEDNEGEAKEKAKVSPKVLAFRVGAFAIIAFLFLEDYFVTKEETPQNQVTPQEVIAGGGRAGESINPDIQPDSTRVPDVNVPNNTLDTGLDTQDLESSISDINNQVRNTIGDVEIQEGDDLDVDLDGEGSVTDIEPSFDEEIADNQEATNDDVFKELDIEAEGMGVIEDDKIGIVEEDFNLNSGDEDLNDIEEIVQTPLIEKPSKQPIEEIKEKDFDLFADKEKTLEMLEKANKKVEEIELKTDSKLSKEVYSEWIDFRRRGRALAYNCKGQHWACVDRYAYSLCEKSDDCDAKAVYKTEKDCAKAQLNSMYKGEGSCR